MRDDVMNRWLTGFIFFLLTATLQAQDKDPLQDWDQAVISKANTAAEADYLTETEKRVILLTNLARTNGPLFAQTFLSEWMEDKKQTRYSRSLERELKKISNLPLLVPQKDLYDIAFGHAKKSGKRGTTGHQDFDKRFRPVMGTYSMVGENCAYGYNRARDIVIGLLIDEGIPDLGHRKNMLNPEFNSVGVAIQPHKTYQYNCVMDFGRR